MTRQMCGDDARYLRGKRPRLAGTLRGTIRVVDLFSGVGGLTLGLEEACRQLSLGTEVRLAVEHCEQIASVYASNFLPANGAAASDVRQWFAGAPSARVTSAERFTRKAVGRVDIIVGGPPCQGHSTLNNYTRGDDPKNDLYHCMVRAAEVLEPECLLIENVPAIERDTRRTLERATHRLQRLGYHVDFGNISVHELGVPQLRKRHVLVAHASTKPNLGHALQAARIRSPRTVRWAIGDLIDARGESLLDTPSALSRDNRRRAEYLSSRDIYDLPNRLRPRCQRGPHKYKSMYGRLDWDLPAQTITTGFGSPGQGRYLHPAQLRALTAHEAARLQFLPDWLNLAPIVHRKRLAEAVGNAVPPKLGFVVAAHLLESRRARDVTPARPDLLVASAY
jgi:DNA (cytosine-5)-methyltransferase 1